MSKELSHGENYEKIVKLFEDELEVIELKHPEIFKDKESLAPHVSESDKLKFHINFYIDTDTTTKIGFVDESYLPQTIKDEVLESFKKYFS